MIWNFLAVFCTFQICVFADVVFELVDQKPWKPWSDARSDCMERGGELAILSDLNKFYDYTKDRNMTIRRGNEIWVGGTLIDKGWEWLSEGTEDENKKLHEHEGCFKPAYVTGGVTFHDNNAEKCFKRCQFKGAVGLKKNICICEKELESVTKMDKKLCDLPCDGNLQEICGGIFAISIYQANNKTVNWAETEPKSHKACSYVNKPDDGSLLQWYSSICEMRIRYLCQFENNSKCGTEDICFRWSSSPATWENAKKYCENEGGQLAEIDSTQEDVHGMPPGEYWVGLQRMRQWDWLDGSPMHMLSFHANSRHPNPKKTCAVVHKIKVELGYSARFCQLLRPYICQFDRKLAQKDEDTTTVINAKNIQLFTTTVASQVSSSKPKSTGSKKGTDSNLYSILYLVVGVAVGMAFVFVLGIIICLIRRSTRGRKMRRQIHENDDRLRTDNFPVCYATNAVSLQYRPRQEEPCDVIYDCVGDDDMESPFRRTQRLLRCGSAYSWRRMPSGDSNSLRRDQYSSLGSRGIEVRPINPYDARMYDDVNYAIHQSLRRPCPPPYSEHSLGKRRNRIPSVSSRLNQIDAFSEVIDTTYVGDMPREERQERDMSKDIAMNEKETGSTKNDDDHASHLGNAVASPLDNGSNVENNRKVSESDSFLNVDTSDLYACVQKVLAEVNETINSTMRQAAARAEGTDMEIDPMYSEVKK